MKDSAAPKGWTTRLRAFFAPRARTLGLMVPIHLVAFGALYIATSRIVENQVLEVAEESAEARLNAASAELFSLARAHPGSSSGGHLFGVILESYRPLNLRLFLPGGRTLSPGGAPGPREEEEMRRFVGGAEAARLWVDERSDEVRIRGLKKIVADARCTPCHRIGAHVGVVSMTIDLTSVMAGVRASSRRNVALLIFVWAMLVVVTTTLVKRSARRSADRLRAELDAATAGEIQDSEDQGLVLDPVAARLHQTVHAFIQRYRRHEEEVVSRLEHTNQLASLGRLAAGLAHEIKNPLAGIQGALEILREDLEPSDSSRVLCDEMLAELDRVNETLQLLLTSARPSAPQLVETDLREFLAEVQRLLSPGLKKRGVRLDLESEAGVLVAPIDRGKIRQALVNLIQNAGDAVADGGRIVVGVASFPDREGVIFTVEDDGPGIPEKSLKQIFEPFFTTKFSGTGLGLTIARSLVEQHGGTLEVQSEAGEGTRFLVLIPRLEGEPNAPEPDGTPREGAP